MAEKRQAEKILTRLAGLLTLIFLYSCGEQSTEESASQLFTLMPVSVTHAGFINRLDYDEQLKKKFNIYTYRNFYNGGGVGLGDVNNDGLIDLFLTSNMGPNVLYLNKGAME
ncbi:MAG: VCBS repeat-containing protein, partial [Bacteroidales bacterium]|nr:VCBS repeat-containing protein [Bacteroidales bacterium]